MWLFWLTWLEWIGCVLLNYLSVVISLVTYVLRLDNSDFRADIILVCSTDVMVGSLRSLVDGIFLITGCCSCASTTLTGPLGNLALLTEFPTSFLWPA